MSGKTIFANSVSFGFCSQNSKSVFAAQLIIKDGSISSIFLLISEILIFLLSIILM